MQLRWKEKTVYSYSARRLVYALCFFLFCVIDQRIKTASGLDGVIETFRDLTGLVMAVIIMSGYRLEDFVKWKIPYIVWSVIAVPGSIAAFVWGMENRPFLNEWIVIILDVVVYGYIVIHTFISVVFEKNYPKLNKKFATTWVVMIVLMLLSRSTYIWPLCYLVMFGCFYLTSYTKETQDDLYQGMLDGILLSFFVMQGFCFVFRPYDIVRYQGIYHNPNLNALYYLEVLAAVFTKIVYVTKNKCNKWVKAYYWIGAGVVLSFELLTIGRAAWVTAIVLIGIFLWIMNKIQTPKRLLKNFVRISLCVVLTFPLCFGAVRYFPTVLSHPIWFWGEWNEERVHAWDEWDSEKYIEIDEYLEAALGRVYESFTSLLGQSASIQTDATATEELLLVSATDMLPMSNTIDTDEIEEFVDVVEMTDENNALAQEALLTEEEGQNGFLVRSTIYKYYIEHLNMWGTPEEEQGFQLISYVRIGHAHNIFLQFGTDFGIPVMIIFALLIVSGCRIICNRIGKDNVDKCIGNLMFLLIPVVFGMFEYSWGPGSLSIMMLFVAWKEGICADAQVSD